MPWKMSDASHKTHKATDEGSKKQWATVANKVLAESGDDAKAIRIANAAVAARKRIRKKNAVAKA